MLYVAQKTAELVTRLNGVLGRTETPHRSAAQSLVQTLADAIHVLREVKERGEEPPAQLGGAPRDQPGGGVAAVAAADLRAGLLSSRELFCVELAVDAGDRVQHATMAALGQGAQEFFRSSPWGDMRGHVFYHLIHPEDRAKLDALLLRNAHGKESGAVTSMRLVHFRTCEMELVLRANGRAHDASLAAASRVPDADVLLDDPIPEDPLLDFATGASARPCGAGAAEAVRGKTYIVAGHVTLDFQLVAAPPGQGWLAGGKILVMAPLHTATPPLPAIAHRRVWNEQSCLQKSREINGIYMADLSASPNQNFMGTDIRVAAPRTPVIAESSVAPTQPRAPLSRAAEVADSVQDDVSILWRLRSGAVATFKGVLGVGVRAMMRIVQFHVEISVDIEGIPNLCVHARLHWEGTFTFPWRLCHKMDMSGRRAFPTRSFRTKPEDQVFMLPVTYDFWLPQAGTVGACHLETFGACHFLCQPREGRPLPSDMSEMPCDGLVCGAPHATSIFHKTGNGQWCLVKTRCMVAEAMSYVKFVKTGEFDEALASFTAPRSAEWKFPV